MSRRRLLNVLSLLGGNTLGRVVSLLYVMLVARALGLEAFGRLATVTAYVAILSAVSDAGLGTLVVRDVARKPWLARRYVFHSLTIRIVTTSLAYACLVAVAALGPYTAALRADLWVGGLALLPAGIAAAFQAVLAARERMGRVSVLTSLVGVITLASAWPVLHAGWGVRGLLVALVVATWFQAALAAWWVLGRNAESTPGPEPAPEPIWHLLRRAWPYAGFGILSIVYVRGAIVILSALQGPEAVGLYTAAFRLVEASTLVPLALVSALFPLMAVQSLTGADGPLTRTYAQTVRVLGLLALPLAVGTTVVAGPVVHLVYGAAYYDAARVLAILAWGLALLFLNAPVGNVILGSDAAGRFLPWALLHTSASLLLAALLASRAGALGAAVAFVVAELSGFGLQLWFIRPIVGRLPHFGRMLARPALAAVAMGLAVEGLQKAGAPLWLLIPVGILVYFGAVLALGEIRAEDRAQVRMWLGGTGLDAPVQAGDRGGT